MSVDRLYAFSLAELPVPLSLMCPTVDPADTGPVPVGTFLAHAPEGWFMFDVGLASEFRDPAYGADLFIWGPPTVPGDGEPLADALAACGIGPQDVQAVVLSHLHNDHTGGLRIFAPHGTPVLVQQAELDALARGDGGAFSRPLDWEPYGIELRGLQGETRIATGITAIPSPGHSWGHQSFLFELASGEKILATYDAVPLGQNLETGRTTTITAGADGPERAQASHDMLVARAAAEGARIIPGHCPRAWSAIAPPPAYLS